MAYATSNDMQTRYDVRSLAEMVSDTDAAVAVDDLDTDPILAAVLDDASGEIDAALLTGGRYLPSQLEALTGNAAAHLIRLTCTLAICFLRKRRPGGFQSDIQQNEADEKWAQDRLDRLARGIDVFDVGTLLSAGTPGLASMTPAIVQTAQLLRDRTRNTYPGRTYRR